MYVPTSYLLAVMSGSSVLQSAVSRPLLDMGAGKQHIVTFHSLLPRHITKQSSWLL